MLFAAHLAFLIVCSRTRGFYFYFLCLSSLLFFPPFSAVRVRRATDPSAISYFSPIHRRLCAAHEYATGMRKIPRPPVSNFSIVNSAGVLSRRTGISIIVRDTTYRARTVIVLRHVGYAAPRCNRRISICREVTSLSVHTVFQRSFNNSYYPSRPETIFSCDIYTWIETSPGLRRAAGFCETR